MSEIVWIVRLAEANQRIEEQDLLLAQWESIDKLNRERSQQRLQRIAELEEQLMIEKEFGMHYHAEFMKLFEKGVEQNERIAELDIALDAVTIHVGRLQKEILEKDQRIAELEAEVKRLTEKNWDTFDSLMANDRHT